VSSGSSLDIHQYLQEQYAVVDKSFKASHINLEINVVHIGLIKFQEWPMCDVMINKLAKEFAPRYLQRHHADLLQLVVSNKYALDCGGIAQQHSWAHKARSSMVPLVRDLATVSCAADSPCICSAQWCYSN
jgi:hypothetical protein